ncbi:MAG: sialate O-acetylesterase [Akkermansiaceae bacterium]
MKFGIIFGLLFLLVALESSGDEYDLYLLAGQSNMDGRGKLENLSADQSRLFKNAIIYYRNPPKSTDGWKPLGPGYSIAPKYKGGLPSKTFGPELGFVATLSKARASGKFALIKGSKGGTSLRVDWNPGEAGDPKTQGPRYQYLVETIELAMAALKEGGHTATLRGLIWHQGESDSKQSTEKHEIRLKKFVARIREDLKAPKLPMVLGQVFDNGKRDNVRTAIRNVSKSDPLVGLVTAEGTTTWDAGTHFDARSQLVLGERFAKEMLKLVGEPRNEEKLGQ